MTYREAVRAALRSALRSDPRVFLMGEDVGRYGGAFAVSHGLLEEFGPERIRDAPLSESAFVGAGIGAALGGLRPIVEVMTVNFSLLALDQVVNHAAILHHMSGGQLSVPLVVRMATGGGRQLAAQHSHSLEGWYAHVPGIKVVAPATVADARDLLLAALQDPDPVFVFEHATLYPLEDEVPAEGAPATIGQAAIRRAGRDVSVVTYGGALPKALAAAAQLASDPPRGDRRRGLAHRQLRRRNQCPHRGRGVLRSRCAGGAGLRRRGADALCQAPRGGRVAAARDDRGDGAEDAPPWLNS
jgi:pyruvate dehydrogenase E1 component beta subunit